MIFYIIAAIPGNASDNSGFTSFRTFRVLRALKSLSIVPGLRVWS